MSKNFINDSLNFILSTLNCDEYPETFEIINECYCDDEFVFENIELADELSNADASEVIPECVMDVIVSLYETEIKEGNAIAMCNLGALYYNGRSGKPDYKKAIHYYEMAAENGNLQARENLGYCYYYGRSVDIDYEKAFHYYSLGAFRGIVSSLYKIGDMYKNGYYVKKDLNEAFSIYDFCVANLNEENEEYCAGPVFLRLGDCLFKGEGTAVDLEKAMFCYQRAEFYLYNMVKNGEYHYKRSLGLAIKGQALVRSKMAQDLPGFEWAD